MWTAAFPPRRKTTNLPIMRDGLSQQLSLFDEDPEISHAEDDCATHTTETLCAAKLVAFLLARRGLHETYVHALFSEILPGAETERRTVDILTYHLFGLAECDVSCPSRKSGATLDALWEALVTIIYEQAFPGLVITALQSGTPTSVCPGPFHAPRHARSFAFKIKYQIHPGSRRGWQQQADDLRAAGRTPIVLCLHNALSQDETCRDGWIILEGEAALRQIREDTGVDPEAVVYLAGQNRRVAQIRAGSHDHLGRRKAALCAQHYRRDKSHVASVLHEMIACDPDALRDVMLRAQSRGTLHGVLAPVLTAARVTREAGHEGQDERRG